jgi:hypothetical protein
MFVTVLSINAPRARGDILLLDANDPTFNSTQIYETIT